MTAVSTWVRAVLRQRRRATVVLSLLIGIAGAAALGAADGGRRTQTAFLRMRAATRGADVLVSVGGTGISNGYYDALGKLPEVESYGAIAGIPLAVYNKQGKPDPSIGPIPNTAVDSRALFEVQRPKVVAGRMFNPDVSDEAMLDPLAAKTLHVGVGSSLKMFLFTDQNENSDGIPLTFKIVGIGVTQDNVVPTTLLGTQPGITLTTAFFRSQPSLHLSNRLNYDGAFVRLKAGTNIPAFEKKASDLAAKFPTTFGTFIQNLAQDADRVQRAIVPLAIALYVFAGLIAVAIVFVIGQAIGRQQAIEGSEFSTLRALGFTRTQAIGASLSRASVVVITGVTLAVAGALPVSLFMPIGPAKVAETHVGFEVNVTVLLLGALALIVVLMLRAVLPAVRAAWSDAHQEALPSRPSILADTASRAGLAPPITSGVRMAFEQRSGSRALPLRSALGGSIIGLAVLMSALIFATSLNRLVTVPAEYGQRWDFLVDSSFGILHLNERKQAISEDRDVSGYTAGNYGSLVIGDRDVPAVGLTQLKGDVYPFLLDGRAAEKPDEIVLGTTVFRRLKAHLGSMVSVAFPLKDGSSQMRVVGRAVFPTLGRGSFAPASLGDGAAVITDDFAYLERIFNDQETETNNFLLVKVRQGASKLAVERRIGGFFLRPDCAATNDCSVVHDQRPIELNVLTRVRSVPLILAGLLALFAAATLAHALLTSVRLRARDLAVLKTMGFVRGQIRATVAWQASALAITTLLFGLPLGAIVGRALWSAFASTLGVQGSAAISAAVFLIAIPLTLVLANIIGALPARAAARTEAAVVLRTE